MSKKPSGYKQQLAREKALYRYISALERGDFDTVASVLHEAENDALLERMILEVNEVYCAEYDAATQADDAALIRQLLREHLPSGIATNEEVELPPLTVNDVMARLQVDAVLKGQVAQEAQTVMQQIRQADKPLPSNLNVRGVRDFFAKLGVSVSERFQKLFRETAIFLSMGREQGMARLAATRRQKALRESKSSHEEAQSQ